MVIDRRIDRYVFLCVSYIPITDIQTQSQTQAYRQTYISSQFLVWVFFLVSWETHAMFVMQLRRGGMFRGVVGGGEERE